MYKHQTNEEKTNEFPKTVMTKGGVGTVRYSNPLPFMSAKGTKLNLD